MAARQFGSPNDLNQLLLLLIAVAGDQHLSKPTTSSYISATQPSSRRLRMIAFPFISVELKNAGHWGVYGCIGILRFSGRA